MNALIEKAKTLWHDHALLREGCKNTVYYDTRNYLTVGIGHKVKPTDNLKLGQEITDSQIEQFFQEDSEAALNTSINQWEKINILTAEWLAALISANFQLGDFSLKFPNSFDLLVSHKFDQVIENLRKSIWNRQTPIRVNDFITAIEALKLNQPVV